MPLTRRLRRPGRMGTYSAKAVYICRCSATAVGEVRRKRSFRRGLPMNLIAMRL